MTADPADPAGPPGAPPPPGADTPVPADAAERAAAAGRAHRQEHEERAARDRLVPTTAIETRAEDRARMRRARLGLMTAAPPMATGVPNPAAGLPAGPFAPPPGMLPAVAETVPQRFAPASWSAYGGRTYGGAPYGQPAGAQPAGSSTAYPYPYAAGGPYPAAAGSSPVATSAYPGSARPYPYGVGPYPYGAGPYPYSVAPAPFPQPMPYGAGPYPAALLLPPRIVWTKRQRSAALLSSWLGQTVMAVATHLLTAFLLIVGFAALLHASGDTADFEADSFTSVIARWTMPDRVWPTLVVGLLVGGGLLVCGWLVHALWAKSAGLAKPHRSAWLAWLCTTASTGLLGIALWPPAIVFAVTASLVSTNASLTTGSMWSTLFWLLGIAAVLTGGVGFLFGWLFLSQARPRIDIAAIMAAEEAAARAADEAELTRVRLRGEPSR
jgi:hypothetical protein